jgi:hypothetical protein
LLLFHNTLVYLLLESSRVIQFSRFSVKHCDYTIDSLQTFSQASFTIDVSLARDRIFALNGKRR